MDRKKKHKVKKERAEASKSKDPHSVGLSYYIHDRVELLQHAFAAMKPRDILAMAPESVRDLSFDKIKELCLEELLGISTKRLGSVLDGTEPPSDTESSDASDRLAPDAISLDSISSDEGDLSPKTISHKNKKHKKCKNKAKQKKDKKKRSSTEVAGGEEGRTVQASEAGLTVLELLELQARARAIKAQLQAEQLLKGETQGASTSVPAAAAAAAVGSASDDDDVLIKEEPPEVVELVSSDEEAPPLKTERKEKEIETPKEQVSEDGTKIVTKRNDLTIIVPKPQTSKRIKLKRNNVPIKNLPETQIGELTSSKATDEPRIEPTIPVQHNTVDTSNKETAISTTKKEKRKKKTKRKKETDAEAAEASDQDEITLQLSDSEKMDLLEDFDRKRYDKVSSSDDSDDSSSESSRSDITKESVGAANSKEDLVTSTKDRDICDDRDLKNTKDKTETATKIDSPHAEAKHVLQSSKDTSNDSSDASQAEVTTTLEESENKLQITTENKKQDSISITSESTKNENVEKSNEDISKITNEPILKDENKTQSLPSSNAPSSPDDDKVLDCEVRSTNYVEELTDGNSASQDVAGNIINDKLSSEISSIDRTKNDECFFNKNIVDIKIPESEIMTRTEITSEHLSLGNTDHSTSSEKKKKKKDKKSKKEKRNKT